MSGMAQGVLMMMAGGLIYMPPVEFNFHIETVNSNEKGIIAGEDGSYKADLSGGYKHDNSGAYKKDKSGDYNPEYNKAGVYVKDDSGSYHPDNSGKYVRMDDVLILLEQHSDGKGCILDNEGKPIKDQTGTCVSPKQIMMKILMDQANEYRLTNDGKYVHDAAGDYSYEHSYKYYMLMDLANQVNYDSGAYKPDKRGQYIMDDSGHYVDPENAEIQQRKRSIYVTLLSLDESGPKLYRIYISPKSLQPQSVTSKKPNISKPIANVRQYRPDKWNTITTGTNEYKGKNTHSKFPKSVDRNEENV